MNANEAMIIGKADQIVKRYVTMWNIALFAKLLGLMMYKAEWMAIIVQLYICRSFSFWSLSR